jgi:hypothetical protein
MSDDNTGAPSAGREQKSRVCNLALIALSLTLSAGARETTGAPYTLRTAGQVGTKMGSLVAWGYCDSGAYACPSANDYIAIAAGTHHNLAIMTTEPPTGERKTVVECVIVGNPGNPDDIHTARPSAGTHAFSALRVPAERQPNRAVPEIPLSHSDRLRHAGPLRWYPPGDKRLLRHAHKVNTANDLWSGAGNIWKSFSVVAGL